MAKNMSGGLRPECPMEHRDLFDTLLAATRNACESQGALRDFIAFPKDLTAQPVAPLEAPASALLQQETGFGPSPYPELLEGIRKMAPIAHWRENYRDSDLGAEFHDRFGCICLVGEGGPFTSDRLRAWVVYMPPHLYYPWHEHKAEELYLILAGSAVFRKEGSPDVVMRAGESVFHAAHQPHATETSEDPVLCLVLWRDDFEHEPVLTDPLRVARLAAQ